MTYILARFQITKQVSEDQWDRINIDKLFNYDEDCSKIFFWYDSYVGEDKSVLQLKKMELPK